MNDLSRMGHMDGVWDCNGWPEIPHFKATEMVLVDRSQEPGVRSQEKRIRVEACWEPFMYDIMPV